LSDLVSCLLHKATQEHKHHAFDSGREQYVILVTSLATTELLANYLNLSYPRRLDTLVMSLMRMSRRMCFLRGVVRGSMGRGSSLSLISLLLGLLYFLFESDAAFAVP